MLILFLTTNFALAAKTVADIYKARCQVDAHSRGFTGHEYLGRVGLIHAGGRLYDPRLGGYPGARTPAVADPTADDSGCCSRSERAVRSMRKVVATSSFSARSTRSCGNPNGP